MYVSSRLSPSGNQRNGSASAASTPSIRRRGRDPISDRRMGSRHRAGPEQKIRSGKPMAAKHTHSRGQRLQMLKPPSGALNRTGAWQASRWQGWFGSFPIMPYKFYRTEKGAERAFCLNRLGDGMPNKKSDPARSPTLMQYLHARVALRFTPPPVCWRDSLRRSVGLIPESQTGFNEGIRLV
jgi:hypothetical protein